MRGIGIDERELRRIGSLRERAEVVSETGEPPALLSKNRRQRRALKALKRKGKA